MQNIHSTIGAATLLLALTGASAVAQAPSDAQQRDAAAATAAAEKEQASVERELEQAREQLQEAARQVARLSGKLAGPVVRDVQRQFRYGGQRAMLGLVTEDTERGVRIASVTPSGPAANAGLKIGDTITEIDGAHLADARPAGGGKQSPTELLLAQMANVDPGEPVKLHVVNEAGAERDVAVKTRPTAANVWINPPNPPRGAAAFGPGNFWFFGPNPWSQMQLVTLTPGLGSYFGTTKGLLVVRAPDTEALKLKDGDVILDIGGREPTSPEHALRILGSFTKNEPLKITIMRNKSKQTLDIKLPADGAPADPNRVA